MLKWDEPFPREMPLPDFIKQLERDVQVDEVTTECLHTPKGRLDLSFQLGRRALAVQLLRWLKDS